MLRRDLAALAAREHDVLVVGGGIHGAAAALEAASRGLAVALVEAADFASGASWNSLKTIHGGLRHLQRLDVPGLRESSGERRALLTIAPGLVRPLAFLIPAHGHGVRGREALAMGVALNQMLTLDRNHGLHSDRRLPDPRRLSRAEVLALVPGIPFDGLSGGVLFWDAQVTSGERLVLAFLHAATGAGAVVVNRAEVTAMRRAGRRIEGALVRDTLTGRDVEVRARFVINAAGAGADTIVRAAGIVRPPVPHLRAINLVLGRPLVRDWALASHHAGRFLFAVPWAGRSIVGTAYAPEDVPPDVLAKRFLDEAAQAYPWSGLSQSDVALVHHGRVPGASEAALLSRSRLVDHETEDGALGMLTIVAAKFTTARALAERAIDRVFARLGRAPRPSATATTPLTHAAPLEGPLEARVCRAVREESAVSLADAVLRRLDLGTAGPPDPEALDTVARVMAAELGWDPGRTAAEKAALVESYPGPLG